jgi:hypothetical protein
MIRVQIKDFDWTVWDYNMFGKFIYTYQTAPCMLSFYFKDPLSFKWGQGVADIYVDDKLFLKLDKEAGPEEEAIAVNLERDTDKKYSVVEIRVKRGPVVIDGAEWMEQFLSLHTLTSDFTGTKVLASSFKIDLKK